MKNILVILSTIMLLGIVACGEAENPHHNALPHINTMPETTLSEQDRYNIATGKGREVSSLSTEELGHLLGFSGGQLHLFFFWELDCADCKAQISTIEKVTRNMGQHPLKLIYVNLDDKKQRQQVNTFIRENRMTGAIYQLEREQNSEISEFNISAGALYLINQQQGIQSSYEATISTDELTAILSPLLL